eukprot:Seg1951.4 transcript_id=Seg1951.4/GoldUCD/mRNA.D3Y31 product="Ankyrin repeat domain-containing protein 2A" protein_id=Seg1951.4/GoldUCD/D3Y31
MNNDSVFEDEAGPLLTSVRMREQADYTMVDSVAIRNPTSNIYSFISLSEESRQSRSLSTSNSYSFTNVGSRPLTDSPAAMSYSLSKEGSRWLDEDPALKSVSLGNRQARGEPFVTNYPFKSGARKQPGRIQVSKSCSFSHEEKKHLETMSCRRSDVFDEQSLRDSPCTQCATIQADHRNIRSLNNSPSRLQTHTDQYQKCDANKRQAFSATICRECNTIRDDKSRRLSSDDPTSRLPTRIDQHQFDTTKRQAFSATICRECDTIREDKSRRLSLDNLTRRTPNRSSHILNWLKNPENQFMFEDKGIEGHIFRSHSAVQNRPNFAKATRFYSLREQARNYGECVHETSALFENYNSDLDEAHHVTDKPNPNDALAHTDDEKETLETSNGCHVVSMNTNERNTLSMNTSGDSNLHKRSLGGASQDIFVNRAENLSFGETDGLQNSSYDSEFIQKQRHDENEKDANDISFKLENLNLSIVWDASFQDHQSITSSNSLPNYGKSKREGKLRRINSDALFYKGVLRNSDRRNTFGFRKRQNRLSIKLRDLVDTDRGMSSQDTGIDSLESNSRASCTENIDVNSKEFVDNIEQIVSHGDVQQIRELADFGFDFNVKDRKGNCGLHYAAERGSEKIVTEILENGGSVWVRNTKDQLPVDLASNINVLMLLSGATMFFRGQYKQEIETRLFSKGMSFEL